MKKSASFSVTPERLWPKELLYWQRMSSREISDYVEQNRKEMRLILHVWGVLEAHGPAIPVGSDSHLAALAADKLAHRLHEGHGIQPIIFDGIKDVGSPSATRSFPGSVPYYSDHFPVIQDIWEQTLERLYAEGFAKHFVVNGDGGNWYQHWAPLKWNSRAIKKLEEDGMQFDGSNWDQVGKPYPHGGTYYHALIKWARDLAPEFERISAMRHGFRSPDESYFKKMDKADLMKRKLDAPELRYTDWSKYNGQDELRSVTEFDTKTYRQLLRDSDSNSQKGVGIQKDFDEKIGYLLQQVLKMFR